MAATTQQQELQPAAAVKVGLLLFVTTEPEAYEKEEESSGRCRDVSMTNFHVPAALFSFPLWNVIGSPGHARPPID